jgi:hypothetical protein
MVSEKLPNVHSVSPTLTVWDEERDLETLTAGLALATTATVAKLDADGAGKPVKRRTLDDMRSLSEHIKAGQRHK